VEVDGWRPDPFGIHEERLFRDGEPTCLVKDGGVGSVDARTAERHQRTGIRRRRSTPRATSSRRAPSTAPLFLAHEQGSQRRERAHVGLWAVPAGAGPALWLDAPPVARLPRAGYIVKVPAKALTMAAVALIIGGIVIGTVTIEGGSGRSGRANAQPGIRPLAGGLQALPPDTTLSSIERALLALPKATTLTPVERVLSALPPTTLTTLKRVIPTLPPSAPLSTILRAVRSTVRNGAPAHGASPAAADPVGTQPTSTGATSTSGSPGAAPPSSPAAPASAPTPHVMVVMMENKNYSEVIGQADQPFTNSLASDYGLAINSYSLVPHSLPNYLEIVSGSEQGVTDDNPPSSHSFPTAPTIADQLAQVGISAKAYAEDLPADPGNDNGEYVVRHVPWPYFPNAPITLADASSVVTDLNAPNPPDFVWYTPNLIDDEHDGTVQQGDAFLSSFIPSVQATSWYRAGGRIIIEWDESDNDTSGINGGDGGHVPTIVVSAALADHPEQYAGAVDTTGILRSIEDLYGLPYLGQAADPANGNIDPLLG
jgi:phosphatidylinositol-3-phosphatase